MIAFGGMQTGDQQDGNAQVADAGQQPMQGGLVSNVAVEDRVTSQCVGQLKIAQSN